MRTYDKGRYSISHDISLCSFVLKKRSSRYVSCSGAGACRRGWSAIDLAQGSGKQRSGSRRSIRIVVAATAKYLITWQCGLVDILSVGAVGAASVLLLFQCEVVLNALYFFNVIITCVDQMSKEKFEVVVQLLF